MTQNAPFWHPIIFPYSLHIMASSHMFSFYLLELDWAGLMTEFITTARIEVISYRCTNLELSPLATHDNSYRVDPMTVAISFWHGISLTIYPQQVTKGLYDLNATLFLFVRFHTMRVMDAAILSRTRECLLGCVTRNVHCISQRLHYDMQSVFCCPSNLLAKFLFVHILMPWIATYEP